MIVEHHTLHWKGSEQFPHHHHHHYHNQEVWRESNVDTPLEENTALSMEGDSGWPKVSNVVG